MKRALADLYTEPEDPERRANWKPQPHLKLIAEQLSLNTGMIFTNGDLADLVTIIDSQVREAPAKVGSLAPADVTVPAGPTGLDPKQTSFFQALNIQTKIVKGQVEIVTPVQVINEGDKIGGSQAALLDKLKIRPFEYKMHIKKVMDNGKLYPASVLKISDETILDAFSVGVNNLTNLSLGSGYIIPSAAPHLLVNAFKNLFAISLEAEYSFPLADRLKNASSAGPAVEAVASKEEAAAEAKKEESEESEEMDMGGFFDM